MSVSVDTGILAGVPSVRELVRGLFGFEGPRTLIVSWAIVAGGAYLSTSVGLVAMIFVALFATFMVGVGFAWLGYRAVRNR